MPGPDHAHRNPTQVLRDEHDVILDVLGTFRRMLDRVERGDPDPEGLGTTLGFFREFADRCHHAKEEARLFPAMTEAGVPEHGGPVGVMLEEHEQGREYLREVGRGIEELASAGEAARRRILDNGLAYVQMLQAHIHKENEILFPLADRVIGPERMHRLAHEFEDAEREMGEGAYERYTQLARELARRAGG